MYNEKVSFTVYQDVKVIGKELTTHFKSVVVFGRAKIIEADHGILVELIRKYANISDVLANKMVEKEISVTGLVEIEVDHISGKIGAK